jgi:hypothetical protein
MSAEFDETRLQHPLERPVFLIYAVLNLLLVIVAIAAIKVSFNWVGTHPLLAKYLESHPVLTDFIVKFTAVISLAVFAPLAIPLIRNIRRAVIRGNSIRLSREQIPEIYGVLEGHCAKLGMRDTPELYLSETAIFGLAQAFSVWRHDYIVLNAELVEKAMEESPGALAFTLGRELGRLRLGHLKWWDEMLLAHVSRIPVIRAPLHRVRTYSCDRYGAFLSSSGLRELLAQAAGSKMLKNLNLGDYLIQARAHQGFWLRVVSLFNESPPILWRAKALYDAGFIQPEDRAVRLGRASSRRDGRRRDGRGDRDAGAEVRT